MLRIVFATTLVHQTLIEIFQLNKDGWQAHMRQLENKVDILGLLMHTTVLLMVTFGVSME